MTNLATTTTNLATTTANLATTTANLVTLNLAVVDGPDGAVLHDASGPMSSLYDFETGGSNNGLVIVAFPADVSGPLVVNGESLSPINGSVSFTVDAGKEYTLQVGAQSSSPIKSTEPASSSARASEVQDLAPTSKITLRPRRSSTDSVCRPKITTNTGHRPRRPRAQS